ncbi:MAG: hypothetical protein WA749_13335 [Gelidibacter sp.]
MQRLQGNYQRKVSTLISPIEVSLNPSTDSISVGQQFSELSQTFDLKTNESGQTTLKSITVTKLDTIYSDNNSDDQDSYQIKGYKINDKNVINKDSIFYSTNSTGKVNIILDGKEINNDEMDAISPNDIASIMVLKDENATRTYGEKGKNGVLVIALKKEDLLNAEDSELNSHSKDQKIISISDNGKTPLYIMDGKEITPKQMEAINPNTIKLIEVLKDENTTKKYG